MKVVIVGAGMIGALTGLRLSQAGAEVTVVDAGWPATAASGASFGWLNASFFADADHFRLRHAAIAAHHRLMGDLDTDSITWPGCLCFEESGPALTAQHDALVSLGYKVEMIDAEAFARLEPHVRAPQQALYFPEEGAADVTALTQDALKAGAALGLKLICGVAVTGIATQSGRAQGVETSVGTIAADRVLLASGTGTTGLLAGVDVPLPMLHRPGLILRSQPLPRLLSHVLVAPGQEVRQDAEGCILAPTAAAHQQVATEAPVENPEDLAQKAADRLSLLLGTDVRWERITLANRPVPQDGLPVMGACGPEGLYTATMHSGATLSALAAELVTAEVMERGLTNEQAALIAPYRPDRFRA